ncbi:MAG: hypothetical protein M5U28_00455 [Sandaracinaceae bacterium]|nr:hypothetical protein [Sandaracinaceae bacterium]
MGFFDKVKGAMNFVTGGAANVTIQWNPPTAMPGDVLYVRITAQSTGAAINSGGVFVDVRSVEQLQDPRERARQQQPGDQPHEPDVLAHLPGRAPVPARAERDEAVGRPDPAPAAGAAHLRRAHGRSHLEHAGAASR